MNKKNLSDGGEFPLWGYFYVGSLFSPRTRGPCHFFRVCGGGGISFSAWGGGHYWACPPIAIFAGASCHKNLSRSWKF